MADVCPSPLLLMTTFLFITIKMIVVIVIMAELMKNVANRDIGIKAITAFRRAPSA